ncbi:HAD domain-containing protein [Arthrobacter sp. CP30]
MYVFHDIDGASHACDNHPPRATTGWLGDWVPMTVAGAYPGHISLELVSQLNDFTAHPDLVNVWLTNWETAAVTEYAPSIGLNGTDWVVLEGLENDASWDWWKLAVLRHFLGDQPAEPFIWIDDDIGSHPSALEWIDSLAVKPLIVIPKTGRGITRADMALMRAFGGR